MCSVGLFFSGQHAHTQAPPRIHTREAQHNNGLNCYYYYLIIKVQEVFGLIHEKCNWKKIMKTTIIGFLSYIFYERGQRLLRLQRHPLQNKVPHLVRSTSFSYSHFRLASMYTISLSVNWGGGALGGLSMAVISLSTFSRHLTGLKKHIAIGHSNWFKIHQVNQSFENACDMQFSPCQILVYSRCNLSSFHLTLHHQAPSEGLSATQAPPAGKRQKEYVVFHNTFHIHVNISEYSWLYSYSLEKCYFKHVFTIVFPVCAHLLIIQIKFFQTYLQLPSDKHI